MTALVLLNSGKNRIFTSREHRAENNEQEEEGKTDEPSKFLIFHAGIRTPDDAQAPEYSAGYKWKELKHAEALTAMRKKAGRIKSNSVLEWTERGPGNVPGRTRALFNVPGDPNNNTWLAGAATGGIWRTVDGGTTWTERSIGFPALPISSFASDDAGTVIYAASGESVSSFYSSIGNGIFKSTDKGAIWTQLPATADNNEFAIVTRIIVHPTDPNIIIATTVPHNLTTDKTSAIMRSIDGGTTWTKVKEVEGFFEQVIFPPGNFNIQYAAQNSVGVWKSIDAGVTWTLTNNGMAVDGRIEISVSPVNSNVVFASAEGKLSGTGSDLYYSSNAASTWSLVDVRFNNTPVDFLEGQGFYDNTVLCDPFTVEKVYVGGVSLFKINLTTGTTPVDNFKITETGTQPFVFLQSFAGIAYDRERLNVGMSAGKIKVEIRFGPGQIQKAHRFMVPVNRTNALTVNDYTYQNYVDVPFEVWDVTNNKQLMVSFRDQNRNGKFDLVPEYLTNDGANYLSNSREYIYINNVNYSVTHNSNIAKTAGQEYQLMYNVFPALATNAVWNENTLPDSKITIEYNGIVKHNATTVTAADGRGTFDNKNKANQVDLTQGVHADHHCIIPIVVSSASKIFKLVIGNDGGVFVSKSSTNPGITEGDWTFKGMGLNTGQFYGADKRPGADQYIGGMQDNGTRMSPDNEDANAKTNYIFGVDGDGFEVIWNSKDKDQLLASRYYGHISKSSNGGVSWKTVNSFDNSEYPFVTKLSNSKDFPDRVFTAGAKGVYVSDNFGESWTLTPIASKFVVGSAFFLDVEVSRANANIVWAGSGMNNVDNLRNLFLSTNGGKTFSPTTNYTLASLGNITKLASHPIDPNTAYALFSFAGKPKIIETKDLGQTWTDISGFGNGITSTTGFPDVAVYCLYVRHDKPNIIWAGTEIGIVESQDNGDTWALLDEFPHVAVWDMKGQDGQVVIATHGRGIWTATIKTEEPTPSFPPPPPSDQHVTNIPKVIASGTSPTGEFVFRWKSESTFDSLQIFINSEYYKSHKNITQQTSDEKIISFVPGEKEIKMISYKNAVPYQSMIHKTKHLLLQNPENSFATYFESLGDLAVEGLEAKTITGSVNPNHYSLQTNHKYSVNKKYDVVIKTPIRISSELPHLFYKDIAIVEPEKDTIAIEATLNGLDWITLKTYDSNLKSEWASAFTNNQTGTSNMYLEHDLDLSTTLETDDLVLFRMRMASNNSVTAWGWSIGYIFIQQPPTASELPGNKSSFSAYPNPSAGSFQIEYTLDKSTHVSIDVVDIFGKRIQSFNRQFKTQGKQTQNIQLHTSGSYLVVINLGDKKMIQRIVIKK
jgi:photosystem II stability/assembly factor-like uncharacterized protein